MADKYDVTVVQRILPHYRVAFFEKLHRELASRGIKLKLLYGQEKLGTVPKSVTLDAEWAQQITNCYLDCLGVELIWQRGAATCLGSSLIVIEQSNRLLFNVICFALRPVVKFKLAFWGHGRNFQAAKYGISERFKAVMLTHVDWWFSYTGATAQMIEAAGFPAERITNVNNSIDTSALEESLSSCDQSTIELLTQALNLRKGFVGMYCGGMYVHKQLQFLLDACFAIKERIPEFSMIFVGDGPDDIIVRNVAERCPWIHYVGAKFGAELAPFYRVCDVLLHPGALGLVVIDSFVVGVPIFTTGGARHGPEAEFLKDGVNSVITEDSVLAYSDAVADYFQNYTLRATLSDGLKCSKEDHSINKMVARFADGVEKALDNACN